MPRGGRFLSSIAVSVVGHGMALAAASIVIVAPSRAASSRGLDDAVSTVLQLRGDTFEIDEIVTAAPEPRPPAARPEPPVRTSPAAARPPPAALSRPAEQAAVPPSRPSVRRAAHAVAPPPAETTAPVEPTAAAPTGDRPAGEAEAADEHSSHRASTGPVGSASRPSASARTYGATVDREGRLLLAPFFTRAIPAAVSADPVWSELPLGSAGSVAVTIAVDGQGAVVNTAVPPGTQAHLAGLVERTTVLLRAGRFALTGGCGAGRETLQVDVTLTHRLPPEDGRARPTDALVLGYDPPTGNGAGRAYFTLASGRHFEARVTVVLSDSLATVENRTPKVDGGIADLDGGIVDGARVD